LMPRAFDPDVTAITALTARMGEIANEIAK
jgi:hypothetical protein